MAERSVHVLHLVVPRRVRGTEELLLYPHPNWRDPRTGRPMLTLPATGRQSPEDSLVDPLAKILAGDLGLRKLARSDLRRLDDAHARLVSPSRGLPTAYSIASGIARIPAADHGRVIRRLRGEWLSPATALALADLSPTARAVIARIAGRESLVPALVPGGEDWSRTARLLAARDGDLEQYSLLFEEIRPEIVERMRACHWTRSMSRRTHDVEDVIADAAIRALEKLESFDSSKGSALVWIWTIARNLAIDRLRKASRIRELSAETADGLEDGERDPAAASQDGEEIDRLLRKMDGVLQGATPQVRRVWELRIGEGRQYTEIAELLNLPMGTVATWVGRTREKLVHERKA